MAGVCLLIRAWLWILCSGDSGLSCCVCADQGVDSESLFVSDRVMRHGLCVPADEGISVDAVLFD